MKFLTFISVCKSFQPILFLLPSLTFFRRIQNQLSNFAFYDTDIEFLQIFAYISNFDNENEVLILYNISVFEFHLVSISGDWEAPICQKRSKSLYPTAQCTYCVHYAIKPRWQRSLCPI
jgi:hypothetical protein